MDEISFGRAAKVMEIEAKLDLMLKRMEEIEARRMESEQRRRADLLSLKAAVEVWLPEEKKRESVESQGCLVSDGAGSTSLRRGKKEVVHLEFALSEVSDIHQIRRTACADEEFDWSPQLRGVVAQRQPDLKCHRLPPPPGHSLHGSGPLERRHERLPVAPFFGTLADSLQPFHCSAMGLLPRHEPRRPRCWTKVPRCSPAAPSTRCKRRWPSAPPAPEGFRVPARPRPRARTAPRHRPPRSVNRHAVRRRPPRSVNRRAARHCPPRSIGRCAASARRLQLPRARAGRAVARRCPVRSRANHRCRAVRSAAPRRPSAPFSCTRCAVRASAQTCTAQVRALLKPNSGVRAFLGPKQLEAALTGMDVVYGVILLESLNANSKDSKGSSAAEQFWVVYFSLSLSNEDQLRRGMQWTIEDDYTDAIEIQWTFDVKIVSTGSPTAKLHLITAEVIKKAGIYDFQVSFEDKKRRLFEMVSMPAWFTMDARLGCLSVHLDTLQCFSAEIYTFDLNVAGAQEDLKINLAQETLRGLLVHWSKRKQRSGSHSLSNGDTSAGNDVSLRNLPHPRTDVDDGAERHVNQMLPSFEFFTVSPPSVITEGSSGGPWRKRTTELNGIEGDLPWWCVDCVENYRFPKENTSCEFYLHPAEGSPAPSITQGKLSVPQILGIHKVAHYVVDKKVLLILVELVCKWHMGNELWVLAVLQFVEGLQEPRFLQYRSSSKMLSTWTWPPDLTSVKAISTRENSALPRAASTCKSLKGSRLVMGKLKTFHVKIWLGGKPDFKEGGMLGTYCMCN